MFYIIKKYYIELLACFGLIAGLVFSFYSQKKVEIVTNHVHLLNASPYLYSIMGIGTVEANTRDIDVGSYNTGIVSKIYVKEGDKVNKNDPLFSLDLKSAEALVKLRQNEMKEASLSLENARIDCKEAENKAFRRNSLSVGINVSQEEQQHNQFAYDKAKTLVQLKEEQLEHTKLQLERDQIALDLLTIKSPYDATVLKIYITSGKYVSNTTAENERCMLIGNINPLYVRVQIDEHDIWRFDKAFEAMAYIKGNTNLRTALKFVRIEPYVLAKHQLRGDNKDQVDTKVMEIIYEIDSTVTNLYVGEKIDVYIKTDKEI